MAKQHPFMEVKSDLYQDLSNVTQKFIKDVISDFKEESNYRGGAWDNFKNVSETKGLIPISLGYQVGINPNGKLSIKLSFMLNERDFPREEESAE